MPAQPGSWMNYLILAVVLGVLALRLRGMRRPRRLRLETLWIVPALLAIVLAAMLFEHPPRDPLTWAWLTLALLVGAALGWRRAKLMAITVDPATHAINQQASPAALLFMILLIVARQGLRYEAAAMGFNLLRATAILAAFAVGLVAATRAEMAVRARRLLAEAQGGRSR